MPNLAPRFAAVAFAILAALGPTADASEEAPEADAGSPFDSRIGWLHQCLAIRNDTLEPGTPVTIMTFEGDETLTARRILSLRLTGKILGKTTSDENCPPLAEIRRGINESEGASFYAVALDDGPFMNPDDAIFGTSPFEARLSPRTSG